MFLTAETSLRCRGTKKKLLGVVPGMGVGEICLRVALFWGVENPGKSHPWTNTSAGGNLRKLSGPLVQTNVFRKRYGPMIGPYEFPPKLVWTNGAQSSLKVSVLTGIGP